MTLPAWLQSLIDWVALHPESAGIAIFIISAVESLALVGILIPGVVILFAFGTLVGTGILPVVPVLLWAFAGAVLGDQISFWLGWNLKERLWQIWPLSRYPQFVGKSQRFFHKYGAASVFIGRFIGPIRPVIPAMAGMSGMPPFRFTLVNLSSAALWSPAYLLPGAVLGASMQVAGAVAAKMALLMVLAAGVTYFCVWASSRLLIRVPAAVQGISITLFSTALIAAVLVMVLHSGNTQLACDAYKQADRDAILSSLPMQRQTSTHSGESLDIRYTGSLSKLAEQAGLAGLTLREPSQASDYLHWLLPEATLLNTPPIVRLHCYQRPSLLLQQLASDGRSGWQIRLWPQAGHEQVWLGQVTQLSLGDFFGLLHWPSEQPLAAANVDWPLDFQPKPNSPNGASNGWVFLDGREFAQP